MRVVSSREVAEGSFVFKVLRRKVIEGAVEEAVALFQTRPTVRVVLARCELDRSRRILTVGITYWSSIEGLGYAETEHAKRSFHAFGAVCSIYFLRIKKKLWVA